MMVQALLSPLLVHQNTAFGQKWSMEKKRLPPFNILLVIIWILVQTDQNQGSVRKAGGLSIVSRKRSMTTVNEQNRSAGGAGFIPTSTGWWHHECVQKLWPISVHVWVSIYHIQGQTSSRRWPPHRLGSCRTLTAHSPQELCQLNSRKPFSLHS